MTIKVAMVGFGRMGQAAAKKVAEQDDLELVAAYDPQLLGQNIKVSEQYITVKDPQQIAKDIPGIDVFVDFSNPLACLEAAKIISKNRKKMIVGVTGLTDEQTQKLKELFKGVGAVIAPNMSIGVNIFLKLVGDAAKRLKGYDIELIEAHHRFKKDAPSGTAKKALKIIQDAVGTKDEDLVYGRQGDCPRKPAEIGVHAIRAADIVGEHTIIFSDIGERFELKHIAHTRESFATGIPKAINYIIDKDGIYDMMDVLGLKP